MSPASLRGADQVRYSWPFELEVSPLCCFEVFTSFHHESLSHGPSAAKPTKGELLDRVETLSQKSRSVKRKTLDSVEKDGSAWSKVQKLGASFSSPSTHARMSGQKFSPPAEVLKASSS